MTTNEFKWIKTINVFEEIQQFVNDLSTNAVTPDEIIKAQHLDHMIKKDYAAYLIENSVTFEVSVNDMMDVVVEITNKLEKLLVD